MGHSLDKIITILKSEDVEIISQLHKDKKYMLVPFIEKRIIFIALQSNVGPEDVIAAYFHAVILAFMICKVKDIQVVCEFINSPSCNFTMLKIAECVCQTATSSSNSNEPFAECYEILSCKEMHNEYVAVSFDECL